MGNASTRREATLTVEICMNDLTVSGAKALARGLIERMAGLGVTISLSQALEAVATSHQYPDWNCFRDALKRRKVSGISPIEVKYPPHRLIATYPGFGSGAVLDHHFTFEAMQPDHFPVSVRLYGNYAENHFQSVLVPKLKVAVINGYFEDGIDSKINFNATPSKEAQGLIINLWAGKDPASGAPIRLAPAQWRPAWLAFVKCLLHVLDTSHLEQAGTLFLPDFHCVDQENADDFHVVLPELMKSLRVFGGKKSLVVTTQNDAAKESLYRSPDPWRLIMMTGNLSRLFHRCPFECVRVEQASPLVSTFYARLFADPDRYLEDTALL